MSQIPNVLGAIFRLREACRNEIRFAADPFAAKTARRMAACLSSGFASPPLMYSRVKRPGVMKSGITILPDASAVSPIGRPRGYLRQKRRLVT